MWRTLLQIGIAISCAWPAFSWADDAACKKTMADMPTDALKLFDQLDGLVTLVPPDESNYIGLEYAAANKANSDARIQAVMSRPLFYANEFHNNVEWARSEMNLLTVNPSPKAKITLAAFMPYHIMSVKDAFDDVLSHDHRQTVSKSDSDWAIGKLIGEFSEIQKYIACWVERI